MAYRDDIIAAQTYVANPVGKKKFLIRVPIATLAFLNPDKQLLCFFDPDFYDSKDTADYCYLRLFPEVKGKGSPVADRGFQIGFSRGAIAVPGVVRRSLDISIPTTDKLIFDVVRRVIEISESTKWTGIYSPIKVVDFCCPEMIGDSKTAMFTGEIGTVRYGQMDLTDMPMLVRSPTGDYLKDSWNVSFSDIALRNV